MAKESTWLKQFYVCSPVCSPSRCAFMTSHYPARHEIHGHFAQRELNKARHMPNALDPAVPTVARLLQQAGYATAHFGKWHLGDDPAPTAYGFDEQAAVNAAGASLWEGTDSAGEGKDPYARAKSTRFMVDKTIEFIKAHKDKPFYVNMWTLLPHALLNPTPEQLKVYADLTPSAHDFAFGKWTQEYMSEAKDLRSQMQVFLASLTDLDEQVGRLLKFLDESGLSERTVVFFSSDNGPEDYRIGNAANAGVGSAGILRARKRSLYEGGVRTTMLVRWPQRVAGGRVDEESVMAAVDFLPTVCKLAGVEVPADVKPDGEDISDILLGKPRARKTPIMWEWLFRVANRSEYWPPMLAIRRDNWKLFTGPAEKNVELYDVPKDPAEITNVAAANPDV
jgi:N-acetylgalactosamine-6-sulfatase